MLSRRYSQPGNEQGGWAEVRANLSDEQWSHRRRMATEHLLDFAVEQNEPTGLDLQALAWARNEAAGVFDFHINPTSSQ